MKDNIFFRENLRNPDTRLVVAEIGINHNGDIHIAKRLIDAAAAAGCDAVKFQKRTVDVVYTPEELAKPRETPFGNTNGHYKRGIEFGQAEYEQIDEHCREVGIPWFASCWDEGAVDFIEQFDPPAYKVASACLTDLALLRHIRSKHRPVLLSTGMSTEGQVAVAVHALGAALACIMHCVSTYPTANEDLNLRQLWALARLHSVPVGYSGHETGLPPSFAAAAMGARIIERHLTLDRAMWGSDQAASVEPQGMAKLVRDIRILQEALGDGIKRVLPAEAEIAKKLRRVNG